MPIMTVISNKTHKKYFDKGSIKDPGIEDIRTFGDNQV